MFQTMPYVLLVLVILLAFAVVAGLATGRLYAPVDQPPTRNRARRFLPVLAAHAGMTRKTCGQCYAFERTGFEELARRAPAAAEAARWLSPGQMAATSTGEWSADRADFDKEGQPLSLGGPRWDEIGTCHARPGVMTFPENTCEKWS